MIDLITDAALIRAATGVEGERIAYHYGKSYDWLWKQGNGEYANFWTVTKKWIRAFGQVEWAKAELFFNDFELFRRALWKETKGLFLPFPNQQEEYLSLIKIRNLVNEALEKPLTI